MKYKYDSMERVVDYKFVEEFVQEFLTDLITYKGFTKIETIEEVDDEDNIIEKEVAVPLTYGYLDNKIELTSLNGYPFIQKYFYNEFATFFKPIKYDILVEDKVYRYLNDEELSVLNTIGSNVPDNMDSFDPDIKIKANGKYTLYNPYYSEHTKEQVTFLLENLSELSFIIGTILNKIEDYEYKILMAIKGNYVKRYEVISKNNIIELKKSLGEYNPDNFKISSIKASDLRTNNLDSIYSQLKNELIKKYKNSEILKKADYIDYLIDYKIIIFQKNYVYNIHNIVKDHHTFCKKLELIKTREVFGDRLTALLDQKEIDTNTVIAWLGISPQTLSDYKRSKTLPDNSKLIILSKNLGVSIDYLLGLTDLKDHKYYSAFESFEKFGFTSEAFNTLYFLKKEHPWTYSHIITTINLLLEEKGQSTLNDITDYLTHRLSKDYYTINTKNFETLENNVVNLLDSKSMHSADKIISILKNFKINLPLSSIDNLDATTLLSIQQNLVSLKNNGTKNIDDMEEQIQSYFESIWIGSTDEHEDIDNDDNKHNDYNVSFVEYTEEDKSTNNDIPF